MSYSALSDRSVCGCGYFPRSMSPIRPAAIRLCTPVGQLHGIAGKVTGARGRAHEDGTKPDRSMETPRLSRDGSSLRRGDSRTASSPALHDIDRRAEHDGVELLDHLARTEGSEIPAAAAGRAGRMLLRDLSESAPASIAAFSSLHWASVLTRMWRRLLGAWNWLLLSKRAAYRNRHAGQTGTRDGHSAQSTAFGPNFSRSEQVRRSPLAHLQKKPANRFACVIAGSIVPSPPRRPSLMSFRGSAIGRERHDVLVLNAAWSSSKSDRLTGGTNQT